MEYSKKSFLDGRETTEIFTGKKQLKPNFNGFDRVEDLYEILCFAVQCNASDIILQTGRPVMAEVHGRLVAITESAISSGDIPKLFVWMSSDSAIMNRLESGRDADSSFEIPDHEHLDTYGEPTKRRFRLNLTAGQYIGSANGYQAVIRSIPIFPPTLEDIGFPHHLMEYATPPQGIVLIAGPTGSGKTTTFAAMLRYILEGHTQIEGNILTFESPIEYSYAQISSPCCTIQQHEIGRHLGSFALGVRNSMRRHPGLLVIGELRDRETMEAAVEASNTGHPVYSTIHANSVALILKRMMNKFPVDQQYQAFSDLTDTCRLLMSQTLVRRADGTGRICLREWLVMTDDVRETIATVGPEKHSQKIYSMMEEDELQCPMTKSLSNVLQSGLITDETARQVLRKYTRMTRNDEDEFLKRNR